MKIDVEKAFTYVKNDPDWVKKFLIGVGLCIFPTLLQIVKLFVPDGKNASPAELKAIAILLPIILVLALASIICALITSGYMLKTANARIKKPDCLLPDWHFGEALWLGIKTSAATLVYIIAFVIFVICVVLIFHNLFHNTLPTVIGSLVICIPTMILLGLVLNLGCVSFAFDFKFASYFNFSRMKMLVDKNIPTFFIYIALMIGISFFAQMASGVLAITILGVAAIPFITFYQFIVSADIMAQFVRTGPVFEQNSTLEV